MWDETGCYSEPLANKGGIFVQMGPKMILTCRFAPFNSLFSCEI